jgi:limonene 1,2-monooxygenase
MPHFKGQLTAPHASHEWAKGMRDQLLGRAGEAIVNAITEHVGEQRDGERRDGVQKSANL